MKIFKYIIFLHFRINVKEVIILSRPKKGKSADERIDEIFSGIVFSRLNAADKSLKKRVKILDGDLQKPNLGLSDEAREYLIQNTQIVLHAAADVRFDQTLKKAVEVNVRGTRDLILMMEKAPNFEVNINHLIIIINKVKILKAKFLRLWCM